MTIPARGRAVILIVLPLVLSALLSCILIHSIASRIEAEAGRYAQSVTDYLAISVTDHLVNDDKLGLNVLLNQLLSNQNFDSASVYNAKGALVAQVSNRGAQRDLKMFTQQVTYESTAAGHVLLGFSRASSQQQKTVALATSLAVHGILILITGFVIWLAGDLLGFWILAVPRRAKAEPVPPVVTETVPDEATEVPEILAGAVILVVKLRPPRLVPKYEPLLEKAVGLYHGTILHHGQDDWVIEYTHANQQFEAICTGLLVSELFREIGAPTQIKLGLHGVDDVTEHALLEKARKHASYLSSISDGQLLASRWLTDQLQQAEQYRCEAFRSSLTPDGEVYVVAGLQNQKLIEGQAMKLLQP